MEKTNRHNLKGEVVLELLLIKGGGRGLADGGGRMSCVQSQSDDLGGPGGVPALKVF